MFNRKEFNATLTAVAEHYEKTAPTVGTWCDYLASANDFRVTLADVKMLEILNSERLAPNYAANRVYHLQNALGRDTTGHAGF